MSRGGQLSCRSTPREPAVCRGIPRQVVWHRTAAGHLPGDPGGVRMTTPSSDRLEQLGPVVSFLQVLWALDHALTRRSKWMARTLGITGTQRFVCQLATDRPGISAGELAAVLHLHPSTLTGVLERLTRRGLLERFPDATDARRSSAPRPPGSRSPHRAVERSSRALAKRCAAPRRRTSRLRNACSAP